MAWVGYNTQASLEAIVKPVATFSTTSKPLTLANVEVMNESVYNDINNQLRGLNITVPITDTTDMKQLATINDYLTAEVVEMIRWKTLENAGYSFAAKRWGDIGRAMLNNFLKGKNFMSSTTQPGQYGTTYLGFSDTTITSEEPVFDMDYEW